MTLKTDTMEEMNNNKDNNIEQHNSTFGFYAYYIDESNNKQQISIKDISETLGIDIDNEVVNNNELSVIERNIKIDELVGQYIIEKGLPSAEIIHTGIDKEQEDNLIRAYIKRYMETYQTFEVSLPWNKYTIQMLGKDIELLRSIRNRVLLALLYTTLSRIFGIFNNGFVKLIAYIILFILVDTYVKLIVRVVALIKENFRQ